MTRKTQNFTSLVTEIFGLKFTIGSFRSLFFSFLKWAKVDFFVSAFNLKVLILKHNLKLVRS